MTGVIATKGYKTMTVLLDEQVETPEFPTFEGTDLERLEARAFDGVLMPIGRTDAPVVMWYRNNPAEVSRARRIFNEVRDSGGALLYKTQAGGKDHGEQIREFDETATEIVTVPRLVGG